MLHIHRHHVHLPVVHKLARRCTAKTACWSLRPAPESETGWLPTAGAEANATTAAGPDGTDTAARPTGTTDEADAGAAASTAAKAGADAVAKDTVTEAASGGLPTAADEAVAGAATSTAAEAEADAARVRGRQPEALMSVFVAARSWSMTSRSR